VFGSSSSSSWSAVCNCSTASWAAMTTSFALLHSAMSDTKSSAAGLLDGSRTGKICKGSWRQLSSALGERDVALSSPADPACQCGQRPYTPHEENGRG
jgi:hypothetical protein